MRTVFSDVLEVLSQWRRTACIRSSAVAPMLVLLLSSATESCGSGVRMPLPSSLNNSMIFFGDSITAFWQLPVHNKGIPGQKTSEMVSRFQADVISSGKPRVQILSGSNDVRQDHPSYDAIIRSLDLMVQMAQGAGIQVILCEIPPIECCNRQVVEYNERVRKLAIIRGTLLVDYYTPMLGDSALFKDGLHPTDLGYAIMEATLARLFREESRDRESRSDFIQLKIGGIQPFRITS